MTILFTHMQMVLKITINLASTPMVVSIYDVLPQGWQLLPGFVIFTDKYSEFYAYRPL